MKKLIAIALALLLGVSALTACGDANKNNSSGKDDQQTAKETFDAASEITVVSREEGSGTRSAFVELLNVRDADKKDITTGEAVIADGTNVVMTNVANDDYAIGYISLGSLNDTVKALEIDGVKATADNVKNGSYAVQRPFMIATRTGADLDPLAKDFIEFIFSAEGQEVVETRGYIAIDENLPVYAGSKPSGTITVGGSSSVAPLMERLIEAYRGVNPNATIELEVTDSSEGMSGTIDGKYDIGMASRELKDAEAARLEGTEIALDGIAVIVNNNNPLTTISAADVTAIYKGEITTWDKVVK